jgi:hypothetical protein
LDLPDFFESSDFFMPADFFESRDFDLEREDFLFDSVEGFLFFL